VRGRLSLVATLALVYGDNAMACSIPVREHPILASHAPAQVESGMTSYKVAISEALLPARYAKTHYPLERNWLGLRGQIVTDVPGASLSGQVEMKGLIRLACFYPGPGYSVTPDGRLVAWITGKFVTGADHTLVLTAGTGNRGAQDGIWRKVRWPVEEVDDLPTLLSEPQVSIVQP
jgi:hypothetical protein